MPEGTGITGAAPPARAAGQQGSSIHIGTDAQASAVRQRDLDPVVRLPQMLGLGPTHLGRWRITDLDWQEHWLGACCPPCVTPPVPQQATAHVMAAGNLGAAGARCLHLRHDPQLVLCPPTAPPLHAIDDLHPG
jgi:hypothetical protein